MDAAKNKLFMEQVVVWPGKDNPGWINLHCHLKNTDPSKNGGKDFVVGWPYKTADDLIGMASWVHGTNNFFDSWFCTSQQSQCAVNPKSGKNKAKRLSSNATWLKAVWIDVDVKAKPASWDAENPGKPWTHYETVAEAWAAVGVFRAKVGLPMPSAVVNSGGGLHVYWISDVPLAPNDWRPYAEGLKGLLIREGVKCDTGLTTDNVRILRVPGTLNHKYSPPRPVNLLHLGRQYKFETTLSFLKNTGVVHNMDQPGTGTSAVKVDVDPTEPGWIGSAPDPAFAGLGGGDALQAGVAPSGPFMVDPEPVFQRCGFLRDALIAGGKDYDNPLWNLSVLCTAFMENGNVIAHKISSGHAGYSKADTQALYDRKVADRAERGIGYPSCSTIAGSGCKACATCPLLANRKSPLNIRAVVARTPPVTATVTARPQSPDAVSLCLPDAYEIDGNGVICEIVETKNKDGSTQETWVPLFLSRIDMPWCQKDPDVIHFRVSRDLGNTLQTSVRVEDMCGPGFEKKLANAGVKYVSKHKARLEGFFMSWLDAMHKVALAQTALAFGWYRENGAIKGFAYGGMIHKDDGTSVQAGLTDKVTQKRFQPTGQLQPWHDAASYILRQKRAELDVVIATAFAAPLIECTGVSGAMISAWGQSGVGKTYALEVGAAVWGHPKESKDNTATTWRSFERRLVSTVNLPAYWDEITNEAAQNNAFQMLMHSTGGVRGGRLAQNTQQTDKGTWATLVSINSNLCFKEYVVRAQPTHSAGLNRVLEYQVLLPGPNAPGIVSGSEAAQALVKLSHNYGNVGLEYATVLGRDHVAIQARIDVVLANLEKLLKPTPEDRFWIGTIAALIVGAEQARDKLSVPFDLQRMTNFLIRVYEENKAGRVAANVAPTAASYAEDLLGEFITGSTMESIWVDYTPTGVGGRHQPTTWKRLFPNSMLPSGIHLRFDQTTKEIMISKSAMKNWLEKNKKHVSWVQVLQTLKSNFGAVEAKKKINAGTPFPGTNAHVLIIDATPYPDLLDEVNRQMPADNSALGASVGMSAAMVVDTGITPADEEVKTNAAN